MNPFTERFGRPAETTASAPGRVNWIGEHTDYNLGFVLPSPIPQRIGVALAARSDATVRAVSADVGGPEIASYELSHERRRGEWIDYVQAVTATLGHAGFTLRGFDASLASSLPAGSGLSSSAALSVALMRALRARFELSLDDVQIARLAQRAENEFVGARVGIMDPLVSSVGVLGQALLIDTRSLWMDSIPVPASMELVVVDSGTRHDHASGDYNLRREECERAAALLGVASLRDVQPEDRERLEALPQPWRSRARHVVTENERVLTAARAIVQNEPERLGELIDASHRSLRDDFEVSTDAIEALVAALRGQPGVLGARITGGGFGGAVLALAREGRGAEAARRGALEYQRVTGDRPTVLLPETPATAEMLPHGAA